MKGMFVVYKGSRSSTFVRPYREFHAESLRRVIIMGMFC